MRRVNYVHAAVLVGICALYIVVRFWHLGASCLWFDEMFSVQAAEQPWGSIVQFVALDLVHPPLFYMFLKVWIAVGGESVFWIRSMPVLFACLAVIPFLLVCRELKLGYATTSLALLLFAANGSLIKYAQEARMYTMLMFLSLLSIWLFLRWIERDKSIVLLVIVNLIAIYVHYFAWTVIGCEVVAVVIFQRAKWKQMLLMSLTLLAAFLPWAVTVLNAARSGYLGENIDWIQRPGIGVLFDFMFDLIEPFYFQSSTAEPASIYRVTVSLLLIIAASTVGVVATQLKDADNRSQVGYLVLFSVPTLVAVFIASWLLPYSVWGTRHLIVIFAPVSMIIAYVITKFPVAQLRVVAVTLVILLSGYGAYENFSRPTLDYVWCGWERLVDGVPNVDTAEAKPIPVYTSENLAAYHSWFADRHSNRFRVSIVKAPGGEFVDHEYFPPRGFEGVYRANIDDIAEPDLIILYRTESPYLTDWLRRGLVSRGYSECPPRTLVYGRSSVTRIEMSKNKPCELGP